MPPSLPTVPQILPRQPGETNYAYRKRRSLALTGETPYQRRIRLAQARGLNVQEARGHRANESQIRRERTIRQTGFTPYQLWRNNQVQWLISMGFQPETTGWSWNKLIRAAPKLRYMDEVASPGAQITPGMLAQASTYEQEYLLPSEWSWERVNEKYESVKEYAEMGSSPQGRYYFFEDRPPEDLPVQWWYYH